jgi:hypothetical protein
LVFVARLPPWLREVPPGVQPVVLLGGQESLRGVRAMLKVFPRMLHKLWYRRPLVGIAWLPVVYGAAVLTEMVAHDAGGVSRQRRSR